MKLLHEHRFVHPRKGLVDVTVVAKDLNAVDHAPMTVPALFEMAKSRSTMFGRKHRAPHNDALLLDPGQVRCRERFTELEARWILPVGQNAHRELKAWNFAGQDGF